MQCVCVCVCVCVSECVFVSNRKNQAMFIKNKIDEDLQLIRIVYSQL